ncbi:MAG TPA: carboxypeptidase-like regulatory domain-containing protein, partial [Acidobacteriaceae bacterium]|nr:carboxypeptidase-like regulatory domain-containing protein [Acidobacteriaceae bacterium]
MRIIRETKRISALLRVAVVVSVVVLVSVVTLHGQLTSGSIVGVVYDQSGAAIPNSTVTATDAATGASREVQTNSSGYYTILSLPPDPYKVTVSATGF